jgi:DNA uptake protein ComE-like DNA-binding protein
VLGDSGTQVLDIGESTYRVQILDAGALVNVNTAPEIQLQSLPLTQEQIDGLLDWRENTTQGRPQGAKDDYYNTLDQPYNTRLGPLTTLDELLLIKGWTARGLYYPLTETISTSRVPADLEGNPLPLADVLTVQSGMPNTRSDGSPRINIARGLTSEAVLARLGLSEAVSEQIVRGSYTSWNDLLSLPGLTPDNAGRLLDEFTFTAGDRLEGKININTVSEALLESLFTLSPDVAGAIASRQAAGFGSLGELATVPGMTPSQLALIADSIGVGSDTWIVRAYGESGGVGVALEAVVGRRGDRMRVLSFDLLNGTRIPQWWNWSDADEDSGVVLEALP